MAKKSKKGKAKKAKKAKKAVVAKKKSAKKASKKAAKKSAKKSAKKTAKKGAKKSAKKAAKKVKGCCAEEGRKEEPGEEKEGGCQARRSRAGAPMAAPEPEPAPRAELGEPGAVHPVMGVRLVQRRRPATSRSPA